MKIWIIPILLVLLIPQAYALRGDTQDTWHKWDIPEDQNLVVSLIDNKYATLERIIIVNSTVMSDKILEIDDNLQHKGPVGHLSTYYIGWHGALNSIGNTTSPVPKNLEFNLTDRADGNIIILLSNYKHPEGFSGFTQRHGDAVIIEIYDIEQISMVQFTTITRHELGHAFGLTHATAPEDLMYPVIVTPFPFISPCNIVALESLYNDQGLVTCEK